MSETNNELDNLKTKTVVNVSGLNCPLPLLVTKKKIAGLSTGDIVQVVGLQHDSHIDLVKWCERVGCFFLGEKIDKGVNKLFIKKG